MKTLTIVVDDDYVRTLDSVVKSSRLYSSRSEFMKDAVREKMTELVKLTEDLKDIREASTKLAGKARAKGWNGSLLSRKEKEKIAIEFFRKKKFK